MEKKIYFEREESQVNKGFYLIKYNQNYPIEASFGGCYRVLEARLLNISYANYCRLLRDNFGAKLIGKKSLYVVPLFKEGNVPQQLLDSLNDRMALVEKIRETPMPDVVFEAFCEEYEK